MTDFFWTLGFIAVILMFWRSSQGFLKRTSVSSNIKVSVIIPARNEEKAINRLLSSLSSQTYKPYEVIVVDDQSDDQTAGIAEQAGAKVIKSGDLPAGWLGKPRACWQGANCAQGDLFLFLDADTELETDGLEKLVGTLQMEHLHAMSVLPYHQVPKFYEKASAFFNAVVAASSGAFLPVKFESHTKGGFGPCLLCDRNVYFQLDGHRAVRDEILEHFVWIEKGREQGFKVRQYLGKGTISFRMYPNGWLNLAAGWRKSLARGASETSPFLLVLIASWMAGCTTFFTAFTDGFSSIGGSIPFIGFYLLYAISFYLIFKRLGSFGLWPALCFPLYFGFFLIVFVASFYEKIFKKQTNWKGRSVPYRQKRRNER